MKLYHYTRGYFRYVYEVVEYDTIAWKSWLFVKDMSKNVTVCTDVSVFQFHALDGNIGVAIPDLVVSYKFKSTTANMLLADDGVNDHAVPPVGGVVNEYVCVPIVPYVFICLQFIFRFPEPVKLKLLESIVAVVAPFALIIIFVGVICIELLFKFCNVSVNPAADVHDGDDPTINVEFVSLCSWQIAPCNSHVFVPEFN
jgi:hypothetical protein